MVIQGPDTGRTVALVQGDNRVGRQSDPITLSDGTASRQHASMMRENGNWVLSDLGSANGTFLNGERLLKPTELHRGDQIRCGSTIMVFSTADTATPAPVDVDHDGRLVDAAIVATVPSSDDSVILPTPEAGAAAIDNLRILYDMIAEIGSYLNADQLLRRVLDKVFEIVQADRGYILLIEPDTDTHPTGLSLKASRIAGEDSKEKIPISRTIINEVIRQQVGILSSNAMSDKRFTAGKSVHDFGIHSAVCAPIKGRGKILGVIHVDCSVSDHTYTTEQLRLLTAIGYQTGLALENVRLYEAAVQSERLAAVGETVAVLSHHIKNILQALGAGTDVVEMGLDADNLTKAKGAWPIVQRNLGRINNLILNMLAFSKDREPQLANININHVLGECIELVQGWADDRGVALLTDLDDIPPIPADADGLHQAFLNLLQNALDAVEDKTGAVTITSRYDTMNRLVIVSVIDNGSGIEPDRLDEIFTPFYSAKGQRGTGLGLAVARKMVQEHTGKIDVVSKVEEGTTFTVTLPAIHRRSPADTSGPAK